MMKHTAWQLMAAALLLVPVAAHASPGAPPFAVPADVDTDGDGLSDFDEAHKYLTDPKKADSDGDGVPDGDWSERREFTYSIRFLVAHLPPADAVTDAFQDARVISRDDGEVVLEIVAYPLATGDRDIPDESDWKKRDATLAEWTRPNLTCDFDEAMKTDLVMREVVRYRVVPSSRDPRRNCLMKDEVTLTR